MSRYRRRYVRQALGHFGVLTRVVRRVRLVLRPYWS